VHLVVDYSAILRHAVAKQYVTDRFVHDYAGLVDYRCTADGKPALRRLLSALLPIIVHEAINDERPAAESPSQSGGNAEG
jgi:hypothetical protein